jgi:hypothetical protein
MMADAVVARRIPSLPGLIAGFLVMAGIALSMFVAMRFLILAGLGAFGPGVLRELGWLKDRDEFQRLAAYRAGYLAYLVGGFAAVLAVSALKWREANLDGMVQWVALVLIVMWGTWLFSSLLGYWGARRMTARILVVFGLFWAIFAVGGHWNEPAGWLIGFPVLAPYLALAWAAGRFPRATGAALLSLSALGFWFFFDLGRAFVDTPSQIVTFVLLLAPLIGCGVALLREEPVSADGPNGERDPQSGAAGLQGAQGSGGAR